jgi:hypothetical protein
MASDWIFGTPDAASLCDERTAPPLRTLPLVLQWRFYVPVAFVVIVVGALILVGFVVRTARLRREQAAFAARRHPQVDRYGRLHLTPCDLWDGGPRRARCTPPPPPPRRYVRCDRCSAPKRECEARGGCAARVSDWSGARHVWRSASRPQRPYDAWRDARHR